MFKFIQQHDQMDCGAACLSMIAKFYGKNYSLSYLRDLTFASRDGISVGGIISASNELGFENIVVRPTIDQLQTEIILPCILHWNQNHFVVLYKLKKNIASGNFFYKIADPSHGIIMLEEEKLKKYWASADGKGVVILFKTTDKFYKKEEFKERKINLKHLATYLKPHQRSLLLMFIFLLLGSLISLAFPFLAQNLIDKGVALKDTKLITLILVAQMSLFIGSMTIELFRNWLVLIVGTKINIQIISDYLAKLLKLPIRFFDTKSMGDFNQRIQDHERIEEFLTTQSIISFFSIVTFSVFFIVLWYYNITVMMIYFGLTFISVIWSLAWLKKRKSIDYVRFQQRIDNQEIIYEIINGVSEIKLNQFEDFKREKWKEIQHKLFEINIRSLKVNQLQISGFEFLNQTKNILVTFLASLLVVRNQMTLGVLLSISYIIGQMNSPIGQLINFFTSLQDAKLSLSRLNEVQNQENEENNKQNEIKKEIIAETNRYREITFRNLSFQYEGPSSQHVLKNINLSLRMANVTAIVGASGSGKTTIMKLLVKFYEPSNGAIFIGENDLKNISPSSLRKNTGVVMQDGFIFGDTIERNIVCGDKNIDPIQLQKAIQISNLQDFIDSLALGIKTKIGTSGNGISGGQKQRILIARAVYKNPQFLFFDEATSALDAENEKIIHDNLQSFFKGKTVVIIAHRLSTVKNADQIIVLDKGEVAEVGNHDMLTKKRGKYYELVKNQLELGN